MGKTTIISTNVDFLRWKYGTHKALALRLKSVLNWKELSDYALGNAALSAGQSASIEKVLNLPAGWLKRDNAAFSELSAQDYELVSAVLACSPEVKAALRILLGAINKAT